MSSQDELDLKALKKIWYQKLKESGFEDIEDLSHNLKTCHSTYFTNRYDQELFRSKEEYYHRAALFLHEYRFLSERDRLIWELHSEGLSVRQIVRSLKTKKISFYKCGVDDSIQRLRREMNVFYFEDKE